MPRNLKPDALKTGSGRRSPEKGTTVVLGPATGMSSAVPNIGQAEWMSLGGQKPLPSWLRDRINSAGAEAVAAHLLSGDAHPASAISFEGVADGFMVSNVEEGLLDLHGAMPKEPPHLGEWREGSGFSGITDWGFLKTNDISIPVAYATAFQATNVRPEDVYPYFYKAPSPLISGANLPFTEDGNDPQTDPLWNSGIPTTSMHGTNIGASHVGAFTRDGTATGQEVMRTTLLTTAYNVDDDVTGLALRREVTISGTIYPADRGVLALIHFPHARGGKTNVPTIGEFLAQPLEDRCVAALLLGQGILGSEKCKTDACDELFVCDGEPGGIFAVGVDADGKYDPFAFPGRATGQYDLYELHHGKNRLDNTDLKAPFPPAGAGQYRVFNGTTPAAGQVRLGTDPNAGMADPTSYGIPVLGAGNIAYDFATPPSVQANVNAGLGRTGHTMVGNTIVRMEDPSAPGVQWWTAANFFRYRLPYLKDYSAASGLKWTPTGTDPTNTRERFRFFDVHQPTAATTPYLSEAGNYGQPFSEDQITWQVARYRHSFLMPSTVVAGEPDEVGSYWLVHFKKEEDFESFVRDGVMPWDATNGYEVYGVETYDTTNPSEGDGNIVNEQSSSLPFDSPFGFAPDYGYVSQSYFPRRNTILLTPSHNAFTAGGTFEWGVDSNAMDGVVYTSGIAAFLPNYWNNAFGGVPGDPFFGIDSIDINETTNVFFEHGFRTDETWLAGDQQLVPPALKDPALISSPSPATITFFSFAYGEHPTIAGTPSIVVPQDSDTGLGLSDYHSTLLPSRVEIPYTHMGPSGVNQYSETNGPQRTDSFVISTAGGNKPRLLGDDEYPSFVEGAKLRAFFRRPMRHRNPYDAVEPYSPSDGHGIVVPAMDDADILFHTTRFDITNLVGRYGNFVRVSPADPTVFWGYYQQYTTEKDSHEQFLDETYRYPTSFDITSGGIAGIENTVYGAAGQKALAGPGLQGYAGGPIEVPVRAGLNGEPPKSLNWAYDTWLSKKLNEVDFAVFGVDPNYDNMVGELQVRGWCDRNPPMTDRADAPYPSTGLLAYPKRDYTVVGSPDLRPQGPAGAGDLTSDQPDYSGLSGERSFVRAFDVSSVVYPSPVGQSFVHLRIDGCKLADLAYHAPGVGGLNRFSTDGSSFIAVLVKVPGLTTWMDVGRADGAGPSKQDAFLDGAGCQVVGPETFDGIDEHSGIPYCQIKCHVGPVATLFASTGIEGTIVGEVPVLVKVVMNHRSKFDMEHEYDEMTDTFTAVAGPGSSYSKLRGICGLRIVNTE